MGSGQVPMIQSGVVRKTFGNRGFKVYVILNCSSYVRQKPVVEKIEIWKSLNADLE